MKWNVFEMKSVQNGKCLKRKVSKIESVQKEVFRIESVQKAFEIKSVQN